MKRYLRTSLWMALLTLILVIGVLAVPTSAAEVASGTCGENLTWTQDDQGTLTISGTGKMSSNPWLDFSPMAIKFVIIEDGVTSICHGAFYWCKNLKSISIGNDVTSIGGDAFAFCLSLESITIPDSVTNIAYQTFVECISLTNVTIGNGVTSIDHSAFSNCTALTSVTVGNSINKIDRFAFSRCTSLKSITIPDSVTSIGEGAFEGCTNMKDVYLGNGITNIDLYTFNGCSSLTSITIPESVTSIGEDAFYNCENIEDVYFGGSESQWRALGNERPTADFIHFSCKDSNNHWITERIYFDCGIEEWTIDSCECGYFRYDLLAIPIGKHSDQNSDNICDNCNKNLPKPDPEPTEPEPTEPEPTEPEPTEPEPTEAKPTEPKPNEPEISEVEGTTRLAGENRLVTSELIANQLKEKMGVEKFQNIIVASGGTFADALPGSYLAAVKNAPILLTLAKDKYVNQTADYIKANLKDGGTVYILGGESAVPSSMETALTGMNVKRVAGADRFGTNLAILKEAGVKRGSEILVCTAKEFADSLSAAATGKPILLVYKKITDEQKAYLGTLSGNAFCVVGGSTAVPDNIIAEICNYGSVSRLAGKDRLDTSILVAQKYFPNATSSVVAYGWDFPDGLCGGSLAYATKSPLILTHSKEKLVAFTAEYTEKSGLNSGYVLGGEGLISNDAAQKLFCVGPDEITVLK